MVPGPIAGLWMDGAGCGQLPPRRAQEAAAAGALVEDVLESDFEPDPESDFADEDSEEELAPSEELEELTLLAPDRLSVR